MESINFITRLICYGLNALLLFFICLAQSGFKQNKKKVIPSIVFITGVILEFWFINNVYLRILFVLLSAYIFELIILDGDARRKILPPSVFGMIYGTSSLVNIYILSFFLKIDLHTISNNDLVQTFVLLCKVLFIVPCSLVAIRIIKKHSFEQKEWVISSLVFFIDCFGCILVSDISIKSGLYNVNDLMSLVIPMVILVVGVFNSLCVVRLNQHYNYKIESDIIKTKLAGDKDMLEKMEMLYENSRIIRHDMKHYLSVVAGFIQEENYDDAKEFIDDVLGRPIFAPVIYYMGSKMVNAVLNNKQRECEIKGIKFDLRIVGDIPQGKDIEISVILSNLIDNAIEAEEKVEEKEIIIDMQENKGMYYISIKNKIKNSVLERNPYLSASTKKDKKEHGIGMLSIRKMVSEMDGMIQWYEEKEYLIINISIPEQI